MLEEYVHLKVAISVCLLITAFKAASISSTHRFSGHFSVTTFLALPLEDNATILNPTNKALIVSVVFPNWETVVMSFRRTDLNR